MIKYLLLAFKEERGTILLNYTSCSADIPIPMVACSHITMQFSIKIIGLPLELALAVLSQYFE